jgi:hypothetical protein
MRLVHVFATNFRSNIILLFSISFDDISAICWPILMQDTVLETP